MIDIPESCLEEIRDHAEREYPCECCGVVLSTSEGAWIVRRCTNIQDELHRKHPASFPRTARTAYYIDPREQMAILRDAEGQGWTIRGLYHSHPDHPARFSEEDERRAMPWGTPLYPDAFYLIVSVMKGRSGNLVCFTWNRAAARFVEMGLTSRQGGRDVTMHECRSRA